VVVGLDLIGGLTPAALQLAAHVEPVTASLLSASSQPESVQSIDWCSVTADGVNAMSLDHAVSKQLVLRNNSGVPLRYYARALQYGMVASPDRPYAGAAAALTAVGTQVTSDCSHGSCI